MRCVTDLLTTQRELLAARLRQMLWVELQLSETVLPALLERARATDLKHSFGRHLLETEGHVTILRAVLRDLGASPDPEESPAFEGLLKEHERLLARFAGRGPLLEDLAHAQAAAATEHLELAAYDSLSTLAEALGEEEVAIRLREVMEQEELALELLSASQAKLLAEKVESERL
jgi:ferritin-like metal-binding protein YciE